MQEFIPYVFPIILNLTVGLVLYLLHRKSKQSGLSLLSIAFFLVAIPSIVELGLGGPYFALNLMEQGFTEAEVGLFSSYLLVISSAFNILFAVLVIVGAFTLSRRARNTL